MRSHRHRSKNTVYFAYPSRNCSAASANQCNTVFGATSKTRAVARIPKPSARQAKTRTMSSTAACLPWKSVPWVSKKYGSLVISGVRNYLIF